MMATMMMLLTILYADNGDGDDMFAVTYDDDDQTSINR